MIKNERFKRRFAPFVKPFKKRKLKFIIYICISNNAAVTIKLFSHLPLILCLTTLHVEQV